MKEKGKHILAYEYYFILGGFASKRSKKEATRKLDIKRVVIFIKILVVFVVEEAYLRLHVNLMFQELQ
jgi:hypothetical protein